MSSIITNIFKEYFKEKNKRELSRTPDNVIYATEASNICMRLVYLNRKTISEMPIEGMFRTLTGDLHHQYIQDMLLPWAKANKLIKDYGTEWRFKINCSDFVENTDCVISGRLDAWISTDKEYVIEIKPSNSLLKDEQYRMQLMQGMYAHKVTNGILYFYNMLSGLPTEKHIIYDKSLVEIPVKRAIAISDCLKMNTLPFAEAKIRKEIGWQCNKICNFKDVCQ